jgi:hypothetical protein
VQEHIGLNLLVGRTLRSVTVNADRDRIVFESDDGEAFTAYHMQDCCESVAIHDIQGDLDSLVGSKIVRTRESETQEAWPADVDRKSVMVDDSWTWTTHVIETAAGASVTIRWYGHSNGWYGESVHFCRTHSPLGQTP